MPDFNFAKGSGKREQGSSDGRGSVLDKYPQRDLSHLEKHPDESREDTSTHKRDADTSDAASSGFAPKAAGDKQATHEDVPADAAGPEDNTSSGDAPGSAGNAQTARPSSKWPLIALLAVVLFLILVAFIWHVNPWPPLRDGIAGLFGSEKTSVETMETKAITTDEVDELPPVPIRSWDYFLQVSSWKELGKADLDAERYRAQGLDVIVESEYIPAKRATFYRVRLGPYASAEDAARIRSEYSAVLPAGAFLDSTRLLEDEFPTEENATVENAQSAGPLSRTNTRDAQHEAVPGRTEFDLIDQPLSGWAVKVSSFKETGIARTEARKLLSLGYPSFITRKRIGATTWYRVLVGPFSEKRDADRYMELLNVTYGNEAYTVNLATD
ncbi:MAG: SPOR domain-containing protein [Bacteroidetes bacterium]|nr:SPOR domain-containing protein [Bacteroidota bacterium]